jgi:hypothetical protein
MPINIIELTRPKDARLKMANGGLTYLLLDETADARFTVGPGEVPRVRIHKS